MPQNTTIANTRLAVMIRLGALATAPHPASEVTIAQALEVIAQAMDAAVCAVFRPRTPTHTATVVRPAVGLPDPAFDSLLRLDGGPLAAALQSGLPEAFDVRAYDVIHIVPAHTLVAPVHLDADTVGLCAVMRHDDTPFDAQDRLFMASLTASLSLVLRAGRLRAQLDQAQRRHDAVLDAAVDALVEVDTQKRIILFNKGATALTGVQAEDAIGRTCRDVLAPHTEQGGLLCDSCPLDTAFRTAGAVSDVPAIITDADGEDTWVAGSYNAVRDAEGNATYGVLAFKDISRLHWLGEEMQQEIVRLNSVIDVTDAINQSVDLKEVYDRALAHVAKAIRFDLGVIHALDQTTSTLCLLSLHQPGTDATPIAEQAVFGSLTDADNCRALRENDPYLAVNLPSQPVCPVLAGFPGIRSYICVPIRTATRTYGVLHFASHSTLAFNGNDFILAHNMGKQIAIAAERAHLFEQMSEMARVDGPTGLYNKAEFWKRLHTEIKSAERTNTAIALLLVDIDNFKWVNTTFGYSQADDVLRRLSQMIKTVGRASDIAFRFGGEELCLILPNTSGEAALEVAERIRTRVYDEFGLVWPSQLTHTETYHVTVSIGVAAYPADAADATILFNAVNAAISRAKEDGKNRTNLYDPRRDSFRFLAQLGF